MSVKQTIDESGHHVCLKTPKLSMLNDLDYHKYQTTLIVQNFESLLSYFQQMHPMQY